MAIVLYRIRRATVQRILFPFSLQTGSIASHAIVPPGAQKPSRPAPGAVA
jgi:hypothetical protein